MKIEDRCYRKDAEYMGDYTPPRKDDHWNPTASSITNKAVPPSIPMTDFNKFNEVIHQEIKEEIKKLHDEVARMKSETAGLMGSVKKDMVSKSNSSMKSSDDIYDRLKTLTMPKQLTLSNYKFADQFAAPQSQKKKEKPIVYPVLDERQLVNDISKFDETTHYVRLTTTLSGSNVETKTTKLVAMERPEWWEYILIYGIFKAAKVSVEYSKLLPAYKTGKSVETVNNINGYALAIEFVPKNDYFKREDVEERDNVKYKVIKGVKYSSENIVIEIPVVPVEKTEEYQDGYFLFENKIQTFEQDYDQCNGIFNKIVKERNLNQTLVQSIIKQINDGRLSRF